MAISRVIGVINIILAVSIIVILVMSLAYGNQLPFSLGGDPNGGGPGGSIPAQVADADQDETPEKSTEAAQAAAAQTSAAQTQGTPRATTTRPDFKYSTTAAQPSQPASAQPVQAATTQKTRTDPAASTTAAATGTAAKATDKAAAATTVAATGTTAAPAGTAAPSETSPEAQDKGALAGLVFCVDPGHQKKQNSELEPIAPNSTVKKPKVSSGTAGIATGIMEYELNLAVALKLRDYLEAAGAEVVMTRADHDVNISNAERAKIGNNANADLVVRIHADGSDNRDIKGVTMLVPSSKYVGDEIAAASKKAGQIILDEVIAATGAKSRGVSVREDMTGFNWSKTPVVLIEMGFMSNAAEDRLLASDAYRDKMASGLYKGCAAYFKSAAP